MQARRLVPWIATARAVPRDDEGGGKPEGMLCAIVR